MSRVQLALNVEDLDAAIGFYRTLFATEPALTLSLVAEPTLHAFCGPDSAAPDPSVPVGLVPLADDQGAEREGDRGEAVEQ